MSAWKPRTAAPTIRPVGSAAPRITRALIVSSSIAW